MQDSVMLRNAMFAVALGLAGCGSLQLVPTPTPTETEITHADPMPANPSGEWDAVLVIVPEQGPQRRPVQVAEAVAHAHEDATEAAVLGVLFVDTAYHETWLCASVVDEEGPRCGAPALRVEGLEEVDTGERQFQSAFNVEWLEDARLFGRIERR